MVKIGPTGGIKNVTKIYEVGDTTSIENVEKGQRVSFESVEFEKVLFDKFLGIGKTPSTQGFLMPPIAKKINVENLTGDENRMILRRFLLKENSNFKSLSSISFKSEGDKMAKLKDVAEMVNLLSDLSRLHDSLLINLVVDKNV